MADAEETLTFKVGENIKTVERRLVEATVKAYSGDKYKAAEALGISLKTLYNKLNGYQRGY